jgi:hypothetical protein
VTRGRVTGRDVTVAAGFIEEPDGSYLVAAGEPDADWALNLEADPHCHVDTGGREWAAIAEALDAEPAGHAVTKLILKYGTPAERLGRGAAFRLRPATER